LIDEISPDDQFDDAMKPRSETEEEDVIAKGAAFAMANEDGYMQPASAEAEMMIRQVLSFNIHSGATAKDIVISLMGLSRSLGTMASITARDTDDKQTCMEATSTIAVAATCEKMLRSITGFRFIENYSFHGQDE
jgi:hypothetical protein